MTQEIEKRLEERLNEWEELRKQSLEMAKKSKRFNSMAQIASIFIGQLEWIKTGNEIYNSAGIVLEIFDRPTRDFTKPATFG